MNRDLEELIRALDDLLEAHPDYLERQVGAFDAKVEAALQRYPSLTRESLLKAVKLAHSRWMQASRRKPTTLPPRA